MHYKSMMVEKFQMPSTVGSLDELFIESTTSITTTSLQSSTISSDPVNLLDESPFWTSPIISVTVYDLAAAYMVLIGLIGIPTNSAILAIFIRNKRVTCSLKLIKLMLEFL